MVFLFINVDYMQDSVRYSSYNNYIEILFGSKICLFNQMSNTDINNCINKL